MAKKSSTKRQSYKQRVENVAKAGAPNAYVANKARLNKKAK
jgi:hypothetical protein